MSSTDMGFNFRGSSGFVTDGTNETYVIASDTYPTTRGGITFGLEDSFEYSLDRNGSNDRRLRGLLGGATFPKNFRVDLSVAGDWYIHLAIGDPDTGSTQTSKWKTLDNSTVLDTYNVFSSANSFFDATGVQYTAANWAANELPVQRTFSSTIFRIQEYAASAIGVLAHLRLVKVPATGGVRRASMNGGMQQLVGGMSG